MSLLLSQLVNFPRWIKITKSYTDFSTAELTNTIPLVTLPAQYVVLGSVLYPSIKFDGGIISAYTISLGIASNVDVMPAFSALSVPTRPFTSNLSVATRRAATDVVNATAISVTGLLNAATNGSVDIWLLVGTIK